MLRRAMLGASALWMLGCAGSLEVKGTVPPPPVIDVKVEVAAPPPPPPPKVVEAPPPPIAASAPIPKLPPGAITGRPPGLVAGAPATYWLWHDKRGWHLRTTAREPHKFRGNIEGLQGPLTAFRPTVIRWKDLVSVAGNRVSFELEPLKRAEGFDWRMASGCARFELLVDGAPAPLQVSIGKAAMTPPAAVFDACL